MARRNVVHGVLTAQCASACQRVPVDPPLIDAWISVEGKFGHYCKCRNKTLHWGAFVYVSTFTSGRNQ